MIGTRASKGRFRRADAVWLCNRRVRDFLGHLQSNPGGSCGAREAGEDAFVLVTAFGRQDDLQALLLSAR